MNEIEKLVEEVIADWDKRYLMKMMDGKYGYFVKRKRLIQVLGDQLTKYGRAEYERGKSEVIKELVLAECEIPGEGESGRDEFYHMSRDVHESLTKES